MNSITNTNVQKLGIKPDLLVKHAKPKDFNKCLPNGTGLSSAKEDIGEFYIAGGLIRKVPPAKLFSKTTYTGSANPIPVTNSLTKSTNSPTDRQLL